MDDTDWASFVQARLPWATVVRSENISDTAGGLSAVIVRATLQPTSLTGAFGNHDKCHARSVDGAAPVPFPSQVIIKSTKRGKEQFESDLGTTREALFYGWCRQHLPASVQRSLAHIYYACEETLDSPSTTAFIASSPAAAAARSDDSIALRRKVIIMEDLACRHGVQAGYFFGPCSLHNWGKDLPALTQRFSSSAVTGRDVLLQAFQLAGRLHASFWLDASLLTRKDTQFLRAVDWLRGEGEARFNATVQAAQRAWEAFKAAQENAHTVALQARVVQLLDAACAQTTFARYVAQWGARDIPWTLVHGDYHPANMMVVDPVPSSSEDLLHGSADFGLVLLDWEVVGVGSGPQELGQFVISHVARAARREREDEALAVYRSALAAGGVAESGLPSMDAIRAEYVRGGLARWCWLFPLCAVACPPRATQYFHDQMFEFMEDHSEDAKTVTMMRP